MRSRCLPEGWRRLLSQDAAAGSVPTSLIASTTRALIMVATEKAGAVGLISFRVATLTDVVARTMWMNKLAKVVGVLVVLGGLGLGAVWTTRSAWATRQGKMRRQLR